MDQEDLELLRAILEGGAQSGQLDPEIAQLKQQAEMIRGMQPNMGLMDAGAFKVAPGWGAALANIGGTAIGQMKDNKRKTMEKQQADIRSGQNQRVLEALMKQRAGPTGGGYPGWGGTPPIVPPSQGQGFNFPMGGQF